jgi:hypothetical protein
MTPDTCGPELREPFAYYDPESCSLKTSQGTFPWDSMPSSLRLPKWGLMRGGELFELPMPEPPTVAPASSSLLPTPVADNSGGLPSEGTDYASPANAAVSLLPTPTSSVSSDGITRERAAERAAERDRGNLVESVMLLPTPAVNDMGAGKTPEQWDEWTAKMRAKHGNGNGHGASLHIEAARIGASTPPPSTAGPELSDDPHQPPLS